MKVKLRKVIRHKGEQIEELNIPLEELTGFDMIEVERQIQGDGKPAVFSDSSKDYIIRIAARAAKIPYEIMARLTASDFNLVVQKVQVFLVKPDFGQEELSESKATTPGIESATFSDA